MRWLLLIYQIPRDPAYLRVKTGRRLQRIGAIALKSTVYVLPSCSSAREDFQWTVAAITEGGGEATVCEAEFVEGRTDQEIEALFNEARAPDYQEIAEQARSCLGGLDATQSAEQERELLRLERRLDEVRGIDFFGAPTAMDAEGAVDALRHRLRETGPRARMSEPADPGAYRGRTWVTRRGVHVDRMASAWLIRRFIDPDAAFRFVAARGYEPGHGELRFDMYDAEFTHEGEQCTFEVLQRRFGIEDGALQAIAEMIHDIDLKDGAYGRPETPGLAAIVAGIALAARDDVQRIARASAVFEDLYVYFQRKTR